MSEELSEEYVSEEPPEERAVHLAEAELRTYWCNGGGAELSRINAAIEALMRGGWWEILRRRALRRLGVDFGAQAEDVASNTLLKVLDAAVKKDFLAGGRKPLAGWLNKVVDNECANVFRAAGKIIAADVLGEAGQPARHILNPETDPALLIDSTVSFEIHRALAEDWLRDKEHWQVQIIRLWWNDRFPARRILSWINADQACIESHDQKPFTRQHVKYTLEKFRADMRVQINYLRGRDAL